MEKKFYIKKYVLLTFIIFVSLIFIELAFKIMAFHSIGREMIRIVLFDLFYSLVFAFILQFFKSLPNKIIILVITFLYGLYGIIQLTFKNLIGNYLSLNASTNNGLNRVQSQIKEFISCIKLQYFILLIPFITLLILFIIKRDKHVYKRISLKSSIIKLVIIIIVYVLGYATLVIPFLQNKKTTIDLSIIVFYKLFKFLVHRFCVMLSI